MPTLNTYAITNFDPDYDPAYDATNQDIALPASSAGDIVAVFFNPPIDIAGFALGADMGWVDRRGASHWYGYIKICDGSEGTAIPVATFNPDGETGYEGTAYAVSWSPETDTLDFGPLVEDTTNNPREITGSASFDPAATVRYMLVAGLHYDDTLSGGISFPGASPSLTNLHTDIYSFGSGVPNYRDGWTDVLTTADAAGDFGAYDWKFSLTGASSGLILSYTWIAQPILESTTEESSSGEESFAPCPEMSTWGYFASKDGAPVSPGGGEADGFVACGFQNLVFAGDPPDGNFLIAMTSRYSNDGGVVPATGTLDGFGATWTRVSYQEASGNQGAAFTEVWVADVSTYTSGFLTYTFPTGSTYDGIWSSVGYVAVSGFDPVDPYSRVREYPATGGSSAEYESPLGPGSLLFSAFWAMDDGLTDQGIDHPDFTALWEVNSTRETPPLGSGEPPPVFDPQRGIAEWMLLKEGREVSWEFADTSPARTWWAMTLEVLPDPLSECAPPRAYWGTEVTLI